MSDETLASQKSFPNVHIDVSDQWGQRLLQNAGKGGPSRPRRGDYLIVHSANGTGSNAG